MDKSTPIIAHSFVVSAMSVRRVETESRESESEEDTDYGVLSPPIAKSRQLTGAVKYRTKFKSLWKGEFTFIASVPGDPYR